MSAESPLARWTTRHRAAIAVAAGFAASRIAFHLAGVRFDASGLPWLWQFLDPAWLRDDLSRSLFYLHAQPPLMNAILGAGLKLGGVHAPALFHALYLATGLGLALALYGILRRLGCSERAAVAIALVYAASPTAVLYEHWLMYTHLESAALVGAAWALARLVETRSARHACLYFALVAALASLRSLYHLVWIVPCVALAFAAARPVRPAFAVACALLLAPVAGVYAKNAWLFGGAFTSSWLGMNLANALFEVWPEAERRALVDAGDVSELAIVPPFSRLDAVPPSFVAPSPYDVPAVATADRASGVQNYNHFAYVAMSRQYARDARALLARAPARYAELEKRAWARFLASPTNYPFVERNRRRIRGWDRLYAALQGVPSAFAGPLVTADDPAAPTHPGRMSWLWLALGCTGVGAGAAQVVRDVRAGGSPMRTALLAFLLFDVTFVAVVSNAVELGENQRFRVAIEPLVLALVAFAVTRFRRAGAAAG